MEKKKKDLQNIIRGMERVVVAFSGGVDSTFLLEAASAVLGENAEAVLVKSPLNSKREIADALGYLESRGARFHVIEDDILESGEVSANFPDRCYYCKKRIFTRIRGYADSKGIDTVIEGSNYDDREDYRPGERALDELGVRSPLREAGLTKGEIRSLSRDMGLPTWNRPSESCLATRVSYGQEITRELLMRVEQGEEALRESGPGRVRLRVHGTGARIEVDPGGFGRIMGEETRERLVRRLKGLGFTRVSLDLEGYRTGSMNECMAAGMNSDDNRLETVFMLETNIDDMNPEFYEFVADRLMERGALDVYTVPVVMKKSRPGILLNVLTTAEAKDDLMETIFRETTTSGIRISEMKRKRLERESRTINTKFGEIDVKVMSSGDRVVTISPEYEDCKRVSRDLNIPLKDVYDEARREAGKILKPDNEE